MDCDVPMAEEAVGRYVPPRRTWSQLVDLSHRVRRRMSAGTNNSWCKFRAVAVDGDDDNSSTVRIFCLGFLNDSIDSQSILCCDINLPLLSLANNPPSHQQQCIEWRRLLRDAKVKKTIKSINLSFSHFQLDDVF